MSCSFKPAPPLGRGARVQRVPLPRRRGRWMAGRRQRAAAAAAAAVEGALPPAPVRAVTRVRRLRRWRGLYIRTDTLFGAFRTSTNYAPVNYAIPATIQHYSLCCVPYHTAVGEGASGEAGLPMIRSPLRMRPLGSPERPAATPLSPGLKGPQRTESGGGLHSSTSQLNLSRFAVGH